MKRLLSGITPSGDGTLHIGNYLGAVKQFIELAKTVECFLMVADLHALTTVQNKEVLQKNTETLILNELALLGDLSNITFFRQSDVIEHAELTWILNTVTPLGLLRRAHAYKDKLQKETAEDDINLGLFNYPILMAADILLYKPDLVPVGRDQKQHIEITRDIAERFNKTYKNDLFPLPDPYIPEEVAVIMGTDGKRKMSKSLGNIISIFESEEIIEKQSEYTKRGGQFIVPVPEPTIAVPAEMTKKHQKVIVVMPAYNAEKTVVVAYRRLPKSGIDEIILVDDGSRDRTFEVAKTLPIRVFRNPTNLGYGGNLKVCLTKALEAGADIIIEYHPDNQYDPKDLSLFVEKARQGYGFALGSRFIYPKEALENRMPLVKFLANRAMSWIDEIVLGVELSEFHSGFRMYTRELLERVPFHQNSDDYLFSFEIIVQAIFYRFRIADVPISCLYHKDMHTANFRRSAIYALGTFKTLGQYLLAKWPKVQRGPFLFLKPIRCSVCGESLTRREAVVRDAVSGEQFSIWFCTPCQLGFTHPVPKRLDRYYPKDYFSPLKNFVYRFFQYRRPDIIRSYKKYGRILDIGCGDGSLRTTLAEFQYEGVETAFSGVKKPFIQSRGVEGISVRSGSKDVVTFWESLEHVRNSADALKKSRRALKKDGVLIIECPNWNSIERRIFGSRWFHYDPPRHLTHFAPKGLKKLLNDQGFDLVEERSVFAPEYIPLGFAQSILYLLSPSFHLAAQSSRGFIRGVLIGVAILALLPISAAITLIFYAFGNSPILLTVAHRHSESRHRVGTRNLGAKGRLTFRSAV